MPTLKVQVYGVWRRPGGSSVDRGRRESVGDHVGRGAERVSYAVDPQKGAEAGYWLGSPEDHSYTHFVLCEAMNAATQQSNQYLTGLFGTYQLP